MEIAVIGAGLAGLVAAAELQSAGHTVVVWEKSRGVGGRTATRRSAAGLRFDHGAPFMHDGHHRLVGLAGLADHELILPSGERRGELVGEGSANAPAKQLAEGLDVRVGITAAAIAAHGTGWSIADLRGVPLGTVDAVVVTAPAPQAAQLLGAPAPELADLAASVVFDPCWAVMLAWTEPLGLPFTAAPRAPGSVSAVAEAPKPGRADGERWVVQADAAWSRDHLEAEPAEVASLLLDRFVALADRPLPDPAHAAAHRWRYSRPSTPLDAQCIRSGTLLAAGDWCGGDTVGAAIRSGRAAAAALLDG